MVTRKNTRKRIYVAGLITRTADGNSASFGEIFNNIRRGTRASAEVFLAGYAPYSPFIDFLFNMVFTEEESNLITKQDFYDMGFAHEEGCHAVYLTNGEGSNGGVDGELEFAKHMGIPIYSSIEDLKEGDKNREF